MSRNQLQSPARTCFPPVVDENVRLLLLGSLPGEESLRADRYYAHPRNQFWRLVETVVEEPVATLDYEERLAVLLRCGVGLWDTVASAQRRGSLDGAMRSVSVNALPELVQRLPALRAIGFNGGTAARIGRRALGQTGLALVDLPSSSPALTLLFAAKAERWSELRRFVID